MEMGLNGKVALVCGGASGIGLETTRMLAAEGARTVIGDINGPAAREAASALRTAGFDAGDVTVDITDRQSVGEMAEQVYRSHGRVDVLVNCAGIAGDKLFVESELEDWLKEINVCLLGPMLCAKAVLPRMIEQKAGRIITLASDSARIGQARLSFYAAAKAGAIGFFKSLAQEVGRYQITVNVVSPSATNTPLRIRREEGFRQSMGEVAYADRVKRVLRMYPLGRLGEPRDIGAAVVFLASSQASWVTGQVLSVNGGFTMP
ncbi:MAG: SDR family oxidoreductase [Candidatus Lambdaproteobacteria bacterium]|nr:SDR family oxidoreductase [Candidatus Lambdaproteobacteria bacterium]